MQCIDLVVTAFPGQPDLPVRSIRFFYTDGDSVSDIVVTVPGGDRKRAVAPGAPGSAAQVLLKQAALAPAREKSACSRNYAKRCSRRRAPTWRRPGGGALRGSASNRRGSDDGGTRPLWRRVDGENDKSAIGYGRSVLSAWVATHDV